MQPVLIYFNSRLQPPHSKYCIVCKGFAKRKKIYKNEGINLNYRVEKGKAIPLQALTGPDGSSRLRLLDFKTIGT
jgi:hypothetical protein